ncbi:hypothetical protein Avbf_14417, partial [Armadillidium vulgare]
YSGLISTGYENTKNTGYGGIRNAGYGGPLNSGYGGVNLKDSVGWSAIHHMSDNLPDLNKAITSSLGLSFGRGDPNVFTMNPDFSVEGMIRDLSNLFESKELQNGTTASTFEKITDFVTVVYNDLHETTSFGIGWLKGGKSKMADLLENLRAELAGQNRKNCRKLFIGCAEETMVEEMVIKVENELKDDAVKNGYLSINDTGRSHKNNIDKNGNNESNITSITSTERLSNSDERKKGVVQINKLTSKE